MSRIRRLAMVFSSILSAVIVGREQGMAQETARLDVILVDPFSRPIADGVIELRALFPTSAAGSNNQAVAVIILRCDSRGECAVDGLSPGMYSMKIRSGSISATLSNSIVLAADKTLRLVIRMVGTTATTLVSLGTVRITPTGILSTGSAPSVELNAQTLAQRGNQNFTQLLAQQPGITLNRPTGGAPSLPVSIVLRGSDPKETTVQIDGHPINNSSTGDFDISLLDPSAFSTVQVLYGLSPASFIGANTEGGSVNFHTLEPTTAQHGLLRYAFGSFATHGYTLATTGTVNRLGYAIDLHSYNQQGDVSRYPVLDTATGRLATLGSGASSTGALLKLRYTLADDATLETSVLTLGSNQDLSAALSTPIDPNVTNPGARFTSYPNSERSNVNTFINGDLRLPIGSRGDRGEPPAYVTVRHMTAFARQNVDGPANGLSEYLINDTDLINDDSVEYERLLPNADLAVVARFGSQRLTAPDQFGAAIPTQTQTSRYFLARYLWGGGAHLQYVASAYYSNFSTFGTNVSPRAGAVWTPNARTVMRASIGSGFQVPLLTEKIVPSPLPPPDVNGLINVGNPALQADYTTEYEIDWEQLLGNGSHSSKGEMDLYRVDQRNDDLKFIPAGASPSSPKLSYPVNIRNSVWQGVALRLNAPLGASGITVVASYNLNQTYPLALPTTLQASSGNLVPHQQFQNVPMHRATLELAQRSKILSWLLGLAYEGTNNDLNRPQFILMNADVSGVFGHTGVVLSANNLTGVYADKFTRTGVGVPYPSLTGPIPTNAYSLQGPSLTVNLAQHW